MTKGLDEVETMEFQDLAGKLRAGARKALTTSQSLRFENTFELEEGKNHSGEKSNKCNQQCSMQKSTHRWSESAKNEQDLCLKILLTSFQDMIRYMACI